MPSLGLACRINNFNYIDTLVGATFGPLIFVVILVCLYALKVAFQSFEEMKLEASLKRNKCYAIGDELANDFLDWEVSLIRRIFSYFDRDLKGVADFKKFPRVPLLLPLFRQGKKKLLFRIYVQTIHKACLEGRQAEVSEFVAATEAKMKNRTGNSIIFFLLLFSFIVLIGTSSAIFEYFQCESFEEVEPVVSYLVHDYSLDCASERYRIYVAYAVLMIIIYPVG